uniref:Putative ovule protein n=1 Tax=Solanum chacoense TaxID=4108 RepID=A0A0V0GZL8_SOLCH
MFYLFCLSYYTVVKNYIIKNNGQSVNITLNFSIVELNHTWKLKNIRCLIMYEDNSSWFSLHLSYDLRNANNEDVTLLI